jgi:hypothetical protein
MVLPSNAWSSNARLRQVGTYMLENLLAGARGVGWKTLRATGLSVEETEEAVKEFRTDVKKQELRPYTPV